MKKIFLALTLFLLSLLLLAGANSVQAAIIFIAM